MGQKQSSRLTPTIEFHHLDAETGGHRWGRYQTFEGAEAAADLSPVEEGLRQPAIERLASKNYFSFLLDAYNLIPYWWYYGSLTERFLKAGVLKRSSIQNAGDGASAVLFPWGTALPVTADSTKSMSYIRFIEYFGSAVRDVLDYIWKPLLLGLMIFDYHHFSSRYGDTLWTIAGGISTSEWPLSVNLGTSLAGESLYWYGFALLAGVPLLNFIYLRLQKFYFKLCGISSEADALLREHTPAYSRCDYVLPYSEWQRTIQYTTFSYRWRTAAQSTEIALLADAGEHFREEDVERIVGLPAKLKSFIDNREKYSWMRFHAITALGDIATSFHPRDLQKMQIDSTTSRQLTLARQNALHILQEVALWPEEKTFFNLYSYFKAQYQLFQLGENRHYVLDLIFVPWLLFSIYTTARFFQMVVQKALNIANYELAQSTCQGLYLLVSALGAYACTVCGNRGYANYPETMSAESCYQSLFSETRSPDMLAQELAQLPMPIADTLLDLSHQSWITWTAQQLRKVVTAVLEKANITEVDFSTATPTSTPIDSDLIDEVDNFISSSHAEKINLQNQPIASQLLVADSLPSTVRELNFASTQLSDGDIPALNHTLLTRRIRCAKLPNNNFTDTGVQGLLSTLSHPDCVVEELDLSNNGLTPASLLPLMQTLNQTELQHLTISFNSVDAETMSALARNLPTSPLRVLIARRVELSDITAAPLFTMLQQCQLRELDVSDNRLSSRCAKAFSAGLTKNTHLKAVCLAGNRLTDTFLRDIALAVKHSLLEQIDLSRIPFSDNALAGFIQALPATMTTLTLQDCHLGDKTIFSLGQNATQLPNLSALNVETDKLTDRQAANLINQLKKFPQLEQLYLNGNNIGVQAASALAQLIQQGKIKKIDLTNTNLSSEAQKIIFASLPHSSLQTLVINGNQVADNGVLLGQQLLVSTPVSDALVKDKLSIDEARLLAREAKPQTNLTQIDAVNTQLSSAAKITLQHAHDYAPRTQIITTASSRSQHKIPRHLYAKNVKAKQARATHARQRFTFFNSHPLPIQKSGAVMRVTGNISKAFQAEARRTRERTTAHTALYVSSDSRVQQNLRLKGEGDSTHESTFSALSLLTQVMLPLAGMGMLIYLLYRYCTQLSKTEIKAQQHAQQIARIKMRQLT